LYRAPDTLEKNVLLDSTFVTIERCSA
jgi:hypothetical protein